MSPLVKEVLEHVLKQIFGMEDDDVKLLADKRIRNYRNLSDMTFVTLDRFLENNTVFEGTYQDIRLCKMYVEVSEPTLDEIMLITETEWTMMDK